MEAGRNDRRRWSILVDALSLAVVWAVAIRLRRVRPSPLPAGSSVAKNSPNPGALLAEADRFSSLFNWPAAHPLYERAEENFERTGDRRNAAYARIGRLRAEFGSVRTRTLRRTLNENSKPGRRRRSTLEIVGLRRQGLHGHRDQRANRKAGLGAGADARPATVEQEMD
jgi:hypothetical protein